MDNEQAMKREVRPGFDNKPYKIVGIVKISTSEV
jgi:putative ABC transport system permease protein